MELDFKKLDPIAADQILALRDQDLSPEEMYAVAILVVRAVQTTARELLGDDEEIEIASQAYMHVARLEQERER